MKDFLVNNPLLFMAALCLVPIIVCEAAIALFNHVQRKREENERYKPLKH